MTEQGFNDLAEYVERRGDWLGRCAYLLTRDHDAALDLVQDTLLRAWKSKNLVDAADDPERYILRIMLNGFRARSRKRRVHSVELNPEHHGAGAAPDATVRIDNADAIDRALRTLNERQRTVIILRYWADLEDKQIAEILQCPRTTVRSLAARGLAKIQRHLESS